MEKFLIILGYIAGVFVGIAIERFAIKGKKFVIIKGE